MIFVGKQRAALLFSVVAVFAWDGVLAEIREHIVADLTPTSSSLFLVADSAILDASLEVFDASENPIPQNNDGISVKYVTPVHGIEMSAGIVQLELQGLNSDTKYMWRVVYQTAAGTHLYPSSSLAHFHTLPLVNSGAGVIASPILAHAPYVLSAPAPQSVLIALLSVPGETSTPVSARVTKEAKVYWDLNNLRNPQGQQIEVHDDTILQVDEIYGRACNGQSDSRISRYRVFLRELSVGTPLVPWSAVACPECAPVESPVLTNAGRTASTCGFNPDLTD